MLAPFDMSREVLTLILASVGILATIVFGIPAWLDRRSKFRALVFRQEFVDVVGPTNPFHGELRILFNGQDVADATLIRVSVENSGAAAIQVSDFSGPLCIAVPKPGQILSHQFGRSKPRFIQAHAHKDVAPITGESALMIEPLLLNPGDTITVSLLVTQYEGEKLRVAGRVSGIKEIRDNTFYFPTLDEQTRRTNRIVAAFTFVPFLILWFATDVAPDPITRGIFLFDHPILSGALTLIAVMGWRFYRDKR